MHMYSTWMHTLQYFYLTNIESNEWFFVQLLNIASVYAVIREFHSGEFQWQVSVLHFVDGHWCSSYVRPVLTHRHILAFTPHMDQCGIQVGSWPLQSHGGSIHSRFQVAWQEGVITYCCHYWLRSFNYRRLTCDRNIKLSTSSWESLVINLSCHFRYLLFTAYPVVALCLFPPLTTITWPPNLPTHLFPIPSGAALHILYKLCCLELLPV